MAKKYLDYDGLLYFWQKLKTTFAKAVDVPTKTSDLTNDSGYITSASVPSATSTTPKMDGTASVGSETKWAKGDHVHPSDTSRVPTTRKVNGKALSADIELYGDDIELSSTDSTTISSLLNSLPGPNEAVEWHSDDTSVYGATVGFSYGPNTNKKVKSFYDATVINTLFSEASTALDGKVNSSSVGQASGVCPLDANSKVDAQYLPSYVDDVIEAYARSGQTALSQNWLATGSATGTVITPEAGKIYVLMADSGDYSANTQFRWSGTTYVKLADGGVSSITNAEIDTIVAS